VAPNNGSPFCYKSVTLHWGLIMEVPSVTKVLLYTEGNSWKLMYDINQSGMSMETGLKFKIWQTRLLSPIIHHWITATFTNCFHVVNYLCQHLTTVITFEALDEEYHKNLIKAGQTSNGTQNYRSATLLQCIINEWTTGECVHSIMVNFEYWVYPAM